MKCNTCQNEDYCYDGNHQLTRDGCADNRFAAYVPLTNADRIRRMTDEELAVFIRNQIIDRNIGIPTETWLSWLKSPVEEVQDG